MATPDSKLKLLLAALCSFAATVATAQMINIELGNNEALEAGDAAGVEVSANWTQVSGWPDFSGESLNYSDGSPSAATVSADFSGNLTTRIGVISDVNTEMYNRGGGVNSGTGSDITVSGLPTTGDWSDGYDVYAYFAPSSSDNTPRTLNLTIGSTTYYTELNTGSANYSGTFSPADSTDINSRDSGKNYALFPDVTGGSFTLTAVSGYANTIAITGMQVVPLGSGTPPPTGSSAFPFPHNLTYANGLAPTVDTQTEMNTLVQGHWDYFRTNYIVAHGTDQYRVLYKNNDTCSEAIGYGMLFAVLMENDTNDTQDLFDGLYRFYLANTNAFGLMCWLVEDDGTQKTVAATDADEDVAMALLFADRQWGSSGSIDYAAEAQIIVDNLAYIIRAPHYFFPPADAGNNYLVNDIEWRKDKVFNPCYFSPAWLREFYLLEQDSKWTNCLAGSYSVIEGYLANNWNGIVPDWCNPIDLGVCQVSPYNTQDYYNPYSTSSAYCYTYYVMDYDGYRIGWRLGLDYLWNGDTIAQDNCVQLAQFMNTDSGGDPTKIKAYLPDGTKVDGSWNELAFTAPIAIAAMADSSGQAWLNTLYSAIADENTYTTHKYFADAQRLISMLILSGNFPNLCQEIPSPPPPKPELISNGGFVTDATGWKLQSGPVHSSENPDADAGSIKMQGDGNYMYIEQKIEPVTAGSTYNFSASVYTANLPAGQKASLKVQWGKADYSRTEVLIGSTDQDGRTAFSGKITAPADAVRAFVVCSLAGTSTGTAWFDNISMTEL